MANNEPWDRLEGNAFDFIQVPPRSVKPRERGLTVLEEAMPRLPGIHKRGARPEAGIEICLVRAARCRHQGQ